MNFNHSSSSFWIFIALGRPNPFISEEKAAEIMEASEVEARVYPRIRRVVSSTNSFSRSMSVDKRNNKGV